MGTARSRTNGTEINKPGKELGGRGDGMKRLDEAWAGRVGLSTFSARTARFYPVNLGAPGCMDTMSGKMHRCSLLYILLTDGLETYSQGRG